MKNWKFNPSAIATAILTGYIGLTVVGCSSPVNSTIQQPIPSQSITAIDAGSDHIINNKSSEKSEVVLANSTKKSQDLPLQKEMTLPNQTKPAIASYRGLIPDGWIVEQQTLGDLNGDGQSDMVLKLIQSGTDTNRKRSLQVLLSTPSGWQKLAFASKLLLCASCGGVMGTENGSHIRVEINDGILVLYQLRGSREAMQTIHRFWIDRNSQELVCIGEDINSYDRVNGNKITDSRNFLTGKRIILESRGKRSNSQAPLRSLEMQISKQLQSIESIDIEEASNSTPSLPLD